MMKTQIGLGVLSIPAVFDVVGLIPGIILLLTIAIITTWSDYMVGVFKLRHRSVYGIDDVGMLLFGPIGREIFGVVFVLCELYVDSQWILLANNHSLDFRCWCGHAWCFDRLERRLNTWRMHRNFCGSRCHHWRCGRQCSDSPQDQLACMGGLDLYLDCKYVCSEPRQIPNTDSHSFHMYYCCGCSGSPC